MPRATKRKHKDYSSSSSSDSDNKNDDEYYILGDDPDNVGLILNPDMGKVSSLDHTSIGKKSKKIYRYQQEFRQYYV